MVPNGRWYLDKLDFIFHTVHIGSDESNVSLQMASASAYVCGGTTNDENTAGKRKRSGFECAVNDCSLRHSDGVKMHGFPKDSIYKSQWVNFVRTCRENFVPTTYSKICSMHFTPDCYPATYAMQESLGFKIKFKQLKPTAVPTIQKHALSKPGKKWKKDMTKGTSDSVTFSTPVQLASFVTTPVTATAKTSSTHLCTSALKTTDSLKTPLMCVMEATRLGLGDHNLRGPRAKRERMRITGVVPDHQINGPFSIDHVPSLNVDFQTSYLRSVNKIQSVCSNYSDSEILGSTESAHIKNVQDTSSEMTVCKVLGGSKHCCWGLCKSDSRYSERLPEGTFFIPFPKPGKINDKMTQWERQQAKLKTEKAKRWQFLCGRSDFQNVEKITRNTYICSLHFLGGKGPTSEKDEPILATRTDEETQKRQGRKRKAPAQRGDQTAHYQRERGRKRLRKENSSFPESTEQSDNITFEDAGEAVAESASAEFAVDLPSASGENCKISTDDHAFCHPPTRLLETKGNHDKNLKPAREHKKNMHQFPLKVKGPVKRVPITDAGSSKIVPKPIKMKGNSETGMTSVPCEQSLIAPQLYRVVVLDELLKSYTLIPPAVPSTSCPGPLRLHEKGNHSSVKRQHQTWTATSDQHAAEFLCDVEVKQEVSSDQEGSPVLSLPLEDCAVKKHAVVEQPSHCTSHQGGVTTNEACSHEIALLQPKCQLQSTTTLKKVLSSYLSRRNSENQDKHHISMINPAFIKKEPEDFETLWNAGTLMGNHNSESKTGTEINMAVSEESPSAYKLDSAFIKKESEDFDSSWNTPSAAQTNSSSYENKMGTEIYPTGVYRNVHFAHLMTGDHQ